MPHAYSVKIVGLLQSLLKDLIERGPEKIFSRFVAIRGILIHESKPNGSALARRDCTVVVRRRLRSSHRWIHGLALALNKKTMEGILYKRRIVFLIKQFFFIGFVVGEERLRRTFRNQPALSIVKFLEPKQFCAFQPLLPRHLWLVKSFTPIPAIAKPYGRQQMQRRRLWPAIPRCNTN